MSSAEKIVEDVRQSITEMAPGTKMPSSRSLAKKYGASPVTVQKAMRTLVALGLVESRPGIGSFVLGNRAPRTLDFGWQTGALRAAGRRSSNLSTPMRESSVDEIGLHSGYPARELLPERVVRSALTRAARGESALARSSAAGLPELQSWFASELASWTPPGVAPPSAREAIIVPGTQSSLSSIFRAAAGSGQSVIMESPTYWGAILAAEQAGVEIIPVASGPEGPDPAEVAEAFAGSGARLFYAQPTFANPTGAAWSPHKRDAMLAVVRSHGAFLVEDDWARDFGIDSTPAPVAAYDDTGHVIYVRSLTKSVSPAIRVGAVIARGPVRNRLLADREAESMYVSGVLQTAALEVVLQPGWRTHQRNLQVQLRQRRDLLAQSMAENMPLATVDALPRGGLNLWVRLPDEMDAERLVRDCEAEGVLIAAGTEWFPSDTYGQHIRLNFAGPTPSRYPEATATIGREMARQVD